MNLIAKLLPEANVLIDLDVSSKKRVFEQVGLLFENNNSVARSEVFDSLFAREKLGSTGLGRASPYRHAASRGSRKRLAPAFACALRSRSMRPARRTFPS